LKNRITSAVMIICFFSAIVLFNGSFPLALNIVIALISVLSIYEIISALGLSKHYVLLVPSVLFSAVLPFLEQPLLLESAYFLYTVVMFSALIFYHQYVTFRELGVIYSMGVMIPTALQTILEIRHLGGEHGMFYVIIAIGAAWVADTGAFLAGSLFGKHKLCPNISPKKSVEGVIGGLILNIAAMLLFGYLFQAVYYQRSVIISYPALLIIGIFGTGMSILGDLSFSLIKRSCHIKDFSEMIPGHGGMLDRFDSVIFTAPFVYLLVQLMPIVIK
jgi:CDP-diglyceride synthetase